MEVCVRHSGLSPNPLETNDLQCAGSFVVAIFDVKLLVILPATTDQDSLIPETDGAPIMLFSIIIVVSSSLVPYGPSSHSRLGVKVDRQGWSG